MEIPIGTKEKKRKFFRKNCSSSSGSSSSSRGGQNSWDSQHSPTTTAISSLNTSFESTSLSSAAGMNVINYSGSATPPNGVGTVLSSPRGKNQPQHHHRQAPGNSVSLDEAEHMIQHRRFMAAPRRARSAERFDGMRINYSTSPGEKAVVHHYPTREELLDRNKFSSPRPIVRPIGTTLVNDTTRQRNPLPLSASGIASPPPPYQAAVNEKTGPPSYRQALAAAAAAATVATQTHKSGTMQNLRHNALTHHRGGAQSFDSEFGTAGSTMRSAVSVPTFSNDVICNCSKCQIQNKTLMSGDINYGSVNGDYNDSAVYMESQAFLMHEIMTDGMAFCSVM